MTVAPFDLTFLSEPFTSSYDPSIFDAVHFSDGLYRVMVMDLGADVKRLYTTGDFSTFTLIDGDWMASVPNAGTHTFQGHIVLPDGTFVLYQNDGTETRTAVWTGTSADIDAATITRQGVVLATDGDCGVFYEAATDTVHIFTEDPASPFGSVSASKLNHWTTPGTDLLTATQHATAIDTGGTWGTGDAAVVEAFGSYWLFCDNTTSHPAYWIALYRSDDLYTWESVDEVFTEASGVRGGDFDLVDMGDHFIAASEYTGANQFGVGFWRLDKRAARAFGPVTPKVGASNYTTSIGGNRATVRAWAL